MDLGPRVWGENERGELGHEPSWAREGEGEGGEKRESDLNAVGPKTTSSGQTGQTGRPYRSDRSGLNWPRLTETIFSALSHGLELMTMINLILGSYHLRCYTGGPVAW